jgi:hypothetical protein
MNKTVLVCCLAMFVAACSSSGSSSNAGDNGDTTNLSTNPVVPSPTVAGEILLSELMADPVTINDAIGEWIEVRNASATEFNLRDCVFSDAASGNFVVNVDLIIGAGEYRTFSRGATPGFTPDFSYNNSGLTLDEIGGDTVTLTCNGVMIDSRTYPPNPVAGSSSALSDDGNGKWCVDLTNFYYFSNSGTPGATNIVCP